MFELLLIFVNEEKTFVDVLYFCEITSPYCTPLSPLPHSINNSWRFFVECVLLSSFTHLFCLYCFFLFLLLFFCFHSFLPLLSHLPIRNWIFCPFLIVYVLLIFFWCFFRLVSLCAFVNFVLVVCVCEQSQQNREE